MIDYVINLTKGKIVLWCYLIWYLVTLNFYFDPSPRLWLNSLGISAVIGLALLLSVTRPPGARPDHWQTFRLFMMPFGVSSFSSLIKNQGFILIIPPRIEEQLATTGACLLFVALVLLVKRANRPVSA
ncbi:MAG: hypothetical protein R3E57_07870 [Porticoccaceae bacterium]